MDAWGALEEQDGRPADRAQRDAAVRLATGLSLVAAPVAAVASSVGASTSLLVPAVILVGFVTSWSQSGRIARLHRTV